jgi:hypothetical protein
MVPPTVYLFLAPGRKVRPFARSAELTPTRIVLAAAVSVILIPFLLPAMHDHCFYLADLLNLVCAFCVPGRLW